MPQINNVKAVDKTDGKTKLFTIAADVSPEVIEGAVTDYLDEHGLGLSMADGIVKLGGE